MSKPGISIKKSKYRWAIVAMLYFATSASTIGGMVTALPTGQALNESSQGGCEIAFKIASCGYLMGIFVTHVLVPGMKPLLKI